MVKKYIWFVYDENGVNEAFIDEFFTIYYRKYIDVKHRINGPVISARISSNPQYRDYPKTMYLLYNKYFFPWWLSSDVEW